MNNTVHISIVSPVYQAEDLIYELVEQLHKNLLKISDSYEIILVNDASKDKSWDRIVEECSKDKRVKGINLSRNFGQHYAITAGLEFSQGEFVVVMDCDLQDRPDEIPNLYNKIIEGWDSVFAQRINRQDNFLKKMFSKSFYKLFSYLTETHQDGTVANFGIYRKSVIQAVLNMKDQIRFFPTMVQWVGFKKYYLPVKHSERYKGESTYNFKSLFRLALWNIIAFSDKPLRLIVKLGFLITFVSMIVSCIYLIKYIQGEILVLGFTSLILSFWFISGIIILILGFIGLYVGKLFEKVKDRPMYIIKEVVNEK